MNQEHITVHMRQFTYLSNLHIQSLCFTKSIDIVLDNELYTTMITNYIVERH